MFTLETVSFTDRLRSFATYEAFMGLGILKFLFVPQKSNDPMIVDGIYARH